MTQPTKAKVALITGASRGIGAATARLFARSGITVCLAARDTMRTAKLAGELVLGGAQAYPVSCDVSRYDHLQAAVDTVVKRFGGLDILVNNAGVIDPIARIEDSSPEDWSNAIDINLKGVFFGIRAAIPVMLRQNRGTIINVSSGAATSALEGWSHYCSSKAGALSLTRCADRELREKGIRVLGISPGTVATDMQLQIKASGINPVSQLDPLSHIPPDWVAEAIAWLCTPAADEYLGRDFSLKTAEGRQRVGLPMID